MLTKIFAGLAVVIAASAVLNSYTQKSALVLREENQANFSPRNGTRLSGSYNRSGVWIFYSNRSGYDNFRGGGPGSGK